MQVFLVLPQVPSIRALVALVVPPVAPILPHVAVVLPQVPARELLIDVAVGVLSQVDDRVAGEPDHHAGAQVHHVFRAALEPGALADLHDHAIVRVVPLAPHVFGDPIAGAQAGLPIPEGVEHALAPPPLADDARTAGD